jgi:hypothetical protein
MINLNIEDVKPGMILAQPVRNQQGVLLQEAGARISKKSIRIFKSWGVLEVPIKSRLPEAASHAKASEIEDKEVLAKQLKEKFSDVLEDPIMLEIFKAAKNQLLKDPY